MVEVSRGKGGTGDARRMGAWAVLRYSAIFAAIVVPAGFVGLDFPATVLAIWVVARGIAQRYRRQITARETLQLALASWAWTFIAWLVETVVNARALGGVAFDLPWQAIAFAAVWGAYVWLARFVIRRNLGIETHVEEAESASQMLAQQEERYTEAKARTITLMVAWLLVGLLGLPAVILFGVIVAIVLGLMGLKVGEGTWFFVSVVFGFPALIMGWKYFVTRKSAEVFPSHRLVLWLRRFNRADLMEFPFASFLERVCRGIAVPITLQDSTVSTARTAAELRPAFYVELAVMGASWFALLISVGALLGSVSWSDLQSVFLGAIAAVALAAFVAVPITSKRLGVLHLGTKRGQRLVQRLIDAIDSNEGVPQTLTVVSAPDESWQSWVLEFMKRADAVLIDVTHLSANLDWELQATTEHLDAEQLILAYGEPEGRQEGIPRDIEAELARLLGEDMLKRSRRFFYKLPRHRRWRVFSTLTLSQKGWRQPSRTRARLYSQQFAQVLHEAFAASDKGSSPEATG